MSLCLRAKLLGEAGFRHGFTLRRGGVSAAPFSDLNLARNVGDDPQAVAENHRRLAAELDYQAEALFEVSQVHGSEVAVAEAGVPPQQFRAREADALLASVPGQAIGIRIADCVPILVGDPETGAVLAIHAGWRGVVAGIVQEAVRKLLTHGGGKAERLLAAVGPHIGPEAFEVGPEVAEALARAVPAGVRVVIPREPRPHADLGLAVRAQLEQAGLTAAHVETVGGCTYADAQHFFSFRRDGSRAGRHLAVIVAGC
ncbi:MAG: peptidoglycan editing factor PgeF [Myxococcales bacterium]